MGIFSKFENKMEDTFDNIGDKMFDAPISPVQIAKKAEKQMRRGKMVGAGKQYAPTLYTVLVNPDDDARLCGYYPTLAGETETYLKAKANEAGLVMDGDPLVRFFTDEDLKSGKFDVIAEPVAGAIVEQLRVEEIKNYGIAPQQGNDKNDPSAQNGDAGAPGVDSGAPVPPNATGQSYAMSAFQNPDEVRQNIDGGAEMPQDHLQSSAQVETPEQQFTPQPQAPQMQPEPQPQAAQMQPEPQPQAAQSQSQPEPSAPQVPHAPQAANATPGGANVAPEAAPSQAGGVSPSAPTTMFSGKFDDAQAPASKIPVADVPPAHLRDNATGKVYTLNAPTIVLGRENTCNIVISDANASRQHAQILYNNGIWMLNDLGSTNGTYINNQEITTRQLNAGDMITIGVTNLQFNIG